MPTTISIKKLHCRNDFVITNDEVPIEYYQEETRILNLMYSIFKSRMMTLQRVIDEA